MTGNKTIRIVIVDDHPVVRNGIKSVLQFEDDIEVCGEAEDGNKAIKIIADQEPDVVVVDLSLKGNVSGIDLVKAIRSRNPLILTLILSMDDSALIAERALKAGAKGYLTKEEAPENIITAIRSIINNELYLSKTISDKLINKHIYGQIGTSSIALERLTDRELDIFKLIGQGYKRCDVAEKLGIKVNTFESHRRKIKEKFHLAKSSELTRMAVNWFSRQDV